MLLRFVTVGGRGMWNRHRSYRLKRAVCVNKVRSIGILLCCALSALPFGAEAVAESAAGKSITVSTLFKFSICRKGECFWTKTDPFSRKLYISKDGRKIIRYEGNNIRSYLSGEKNKDGVLISVHGSKITSSKYKRQDPEFGYTITLSGGKCRFTPFMKWPRMGYTSEFKFLRRTKCTVRRGNIFAK